MNLVRWFRKNNTKVMAVVVIVIMIGFIGGSALPRLLGGGRGLHRAVAHFAPNRKISSYDLNVAESELNLLRILRVDQMLTWQDLHGVLLGELLFSEQRASPELVNDIKLTIRKNQYRISDKQINDIYRRTEQTKVYWLLLTDEAQRAGIKVSKEGAGELLGSLMPRLFGGQSYKQVIRSIVNAKGIPEDRILATVAKLLGVLQYSHMVCSSEDVTRRQVRQAASFEQEAIDIELVKFDSDVFAKTQEPTEDQMAEQFEKYKSVLAGAVSDENPYGFGYKLPDRIQLEYIAVKLDDIRGIVSPPTRDEKVGYYNKQKDRLFTEQVPLDPNDPNSPLTTITKDYSDVAESISQQLWRDKTNSAANSILQEAKGLTEAEAAPEDADVDVDEEAASPTVERLKELAGDYKTAAEQLIKKHTKVVFSLTPQHQSDLDGGTVTEALRKEFKDSQRPLSQEAAVSVAEAGGKWLIADEDRLYHVKKEQDKLDVYYKPTVYAGQTGLLSADDMQNDAHLGALYLQGYGQARLGLTQVVFAVDELAASELGPFDVAKPRMYENLGPVRDYLGQTMVVVRIIEAHKASEPESIDQTFSISSLDFDPNEEKTDEAVYSVKEKVTEDLKRLAAMETAKNKAEEFVELVAKDGWDSALAKFNELYGQQEKELPTDPNVFTLQDFTGLRRISRTALVTLAVRSQGSPTARSFLNARKKERQFIDQLYSLVPQDSNSVEAFPVVMEFKPDMSCCVIKNISIQPLWKEQYEQVKAMRLYGEDHVQSQSLAAVHFNPENILKRTRFGWILAGEQAKEQAKDANVPAESEAAS